MKIRSVTLETKLENNNAVIYIFSGQSNSDSKQPNVLHAWGADFF